ncbi:hypothetical protein D3C85_1277780 [compost metagenome]
MRKLAFRANWRRWSSISRRSTGPESGRPLEVNARSTSSENCPASSISCGSTPATYALDELRSESCAMKLPSFDEAGLNLLRNQLSAGSSKNWIVPSLTTRGLPRSSAKLLTKSGFTPDISARTAIGISGRKAARPAQIKSICDLSGGAAASRSVAMDFSKRVSMTLSTVVGFGPSRRRVSGSIF